jgi:hypothetical protein
MMPDAGKPTVERARGGKTKPVNPLAWWYTQRMAGEEHDGLTQMALDVLTIPGEYYNTKYRTPTNLPLYLATSVEVERAFSFVSHLVSKRRHRMAVYTIQTTATVGAYSRADLIPTGMLSDAHRKACEKAQVNARAKAAKAKMIAAEAEAEAIAAEVLEPEESDGEDMDDEDILQPSSEVGIDESEVDEE